MGGDPGRDDYGYGIVGPTPESKAVFSGCFEVMLIQEYIEDEYRKYLASTDDHALLDKQVDSLMQWGVRRWNLIEVPEWAEEEVGRVYMGDEKPQERLVVLKRWPLEQANGKLIGDLDSRIADFFRSLKGIGIQRPSIVGYQRYFHYIFLRETEKIFGESMQKWAGASLILNRLESTGRLATRFDKFDMFGPVRIWKKDRVLVFFDRNIMRPALVRRGLMKK